MDVTTYLFSAAVVASLHAVPEPPRQRVKGVLPLLREVGEGIRWVYGRSGLARLAVATHVWFAAQAVLVVVVVPYAYRRLALTPLELGLVLAVAGAGALVGALVSTAVGARLGTGGTIACSYLVSAVAVAVMAAAVLVPAGWVAAGVLAAGQLGHGWAMGLGNSHEMSYRQALTPDGLQARTNTTMRSLNRGVVVLVSPIAGVLAARTGPVPALLASAVVFAAAGLLLLSRFRDAQAGGAAVRDRER